MKNEKSNCAISVVVAITVLREGSEVVLFLYSIYLSSGLGINDLFIGGILGVIGGVLVSYGLYKGITLIPLKMIFSSSNFILSLISAGLASQSVGILASIDFIPNFGSQIWNSTYFLSDNSWFGVLAHSILGYTARPMGIQVITWITFLFAILVITYQIKKVKFKET